MSGGVKILVSFIGGAFTGVCATRLWDYYKTNKDKKSEEIIDTKDDENYVSFSDICMTHEELDAANKRVEEINEMVDIIKERSYAVESEDDTPEYSDNIDILNEESYLELGEDINLIDLDYYEIDGFFVKDGNIVSSTDYPWLSSDIVELTDDDDMYLMNNETGEAVEIHKIRDYSYYEEGV